MTSRARVLAVILLTPAPVLSIFALLAAIPLTSPLLGVTANVTFFIQSWLAYSVMTFSALLFIRSSLWLTHMVCQSALISLLTAGSNELVMLGTAMLWEFPIPFRCVLGIPSFTLLLMLWHVVVLGTRACHCLGKLHGYLKFFCAQISIFVVFQGVAVMFANASQWGQAIITVGIPVLRAILIRVIWRFSSCLEDISTDVAICLVEIFGSLFQNACLQSVRSPGIGPLIIVLDIVQGILETRYYLESKFVDGQQTMRTAVKILDEAVHPGVFTSRRPSKRRSKGVFMSVHKSNSIPVSLSHTRNKTKVVSNWSSYALSSSKIAADSNMVLDVDKIDLDDIGENRASKCTAHSAPTLLSGLTPNRSTSIDNVSIPHRQHAAVLLTILQLVFFSEVLLFAEFAEFACSLLYVLYVVTIYHLPYAKFNFSVMELSDDHFWAAVTNSFIYTGLEGISMLLLFFYVRSKYSISTFYQLAFVLEKYWMTVQGKLVGSLSLIFILNTVHQGTDYTLTFNWEAILKRTQQQLPST